MPSQRGANASTRQSSLSHAVLSRASPPPFNSCARGIRFCPSTALMNAWSWLPRKLFYIDSTRWPYRRRTRPWVLRVAIALVGLGVLFGTIVFAIRAAGHDPFRRANTANPQLARIADGLAGISLALQRERSTPANVVASALATSELYSNWRDRLTTSERASADAAIPAQLAGAFVTVAKGRLGPGTKNLLGSLFSELLSLPGPRSASAAAGLASIASLLPSAQQALLTATLSETMSKAVDGVVHGGSEEIGKRAIDNLFGWLGGGESNTSGTETVKLEILPPAPIAVRFGSPPLVKVRLDPTSFVWGGQTWEWGGLHRFEFAFALVHRGEAKACIAQQLVALYERHPVIRRVFGIAAPRRGATAPCR
jgi:hypothetical protein